MAKIDFRPEEVEPDAGSFEPLPPGDYHCQVTGSEVKPTKAGNGTILVLTSQVQDGPYAGRLIFDNLNIENPNETAEKISKQALRALCDAIGVSGHVEDSEALHFKSFIGRITIRQDKSGQFGPKNAIRYRPLPGAFGHPSATASGTPLPAAPAPKVQPIRTAPAAARPWVK